MKMETLRRLRLIATPYDYWVSFDMKDGFYALAIAPQEREAFTIHIDGQLLQLCTLPMGWSLSPYTFQKLTEAFTNYLRDPERSTNSSEGLLSPPTKAKRKWLRRRKRLTGARLLPFVDDFALFPEGFDATMLLNDKIFSLLLSLGLHIHETKGHHIATQVGDHMGMTLDFKCGVFRAPIEKLKGIAKLSTQLLCKAAENKR